MGGLRVESRKGGVAVTRANARYPVGTLFTIINEQKVTGALQFANLVAAAVASNSLTLSSVAPPKPGQQKLPPVPVTAWAKALTVIDTSRGVQIAHSAQPDEIGSYLKKLDGVIINSTVDLAPPLSRLATMGAPNGYSVTTETAYGPTDPLETDPPLVKSTTSLNGRLSAGERSYFESLANAVAATPPLSTSDARYEAQWGVLARLAGRTFNRLTANPGVPCQKVLTTDCLVFFRWDRPGEILARDWYNELGLLIAADLIVPSAKPGAFVVYRRNAAGDYVRQSVIQASQERFNEDGWTLSLRVAPYINPPPGHETHAYTLYTSGMSVVLFSTERAKAVQQGVNGMAHIRQQLAQAEKDRRDQAKRARMTGIYNALVGVGQAIDQGNRQQQAEFDNRMAALIAAQEADRRRAEAARAVAAQQRPVEAARQVATMPSSAGQGAQVPRSGPAPGAGMTSRPAAAYSPAAAKPQAGDSAQGGMRPRSTRAYFLTGLAPTAKNTRNPLCYSTPFTITFMSDPRGGDGEREQAAAARYVQTFLAKCSQFGKVDPGPSPWAQIEGGTSGWPYPTLHREDTQVTLP